MTDRIGGLPDVEGAEEREALVLFAEAPIEGAVNLALIGRFTPPEAAELQTAFLRDTFAIMDEVWAERDTLSIVLCYAPEGAEEAFEEIDHDGCLMIPQRGADHGERLANAFSTLFDSGYKRVVAIGADTPALPIENILEAFDNLEDDGMAVIGPSGDGDLYLIGLRALPEGLLSDLPWKGGELQSATAARMRSAGLELIELSPHQRCGRPAGFSLLEEDLALRKGVASKTRRFLAGHPRG